MALATRCPHCRTVFRINTEQMRAHNGMVRCGSCRQIFNAVDHLDYIDAGPPVQPQIAAQTLPQAAGQAAAQTAAPPRPAVPSAAVAQARTVPGPAVAPAPATAASAAASSAASAAALSGAAVSHAARSPNAAAAAALSAAAAPGTGAEHAPASASTRSARDEAAKPRAVEVPPAPEARAERRARPARAPVRTAEEASIAVDTLFAAPPGESDEDYDAPFEEDDPVFLRPVPEGRQRAARVALRTACALLAPLLLLQLALMYRTVLMARVPELRPALSAVCEVLSCGAEWPMRPEYLAVVSSELQGIAGGNAMEFNAVIRNRADFPMALPAVELTLTDTFDHTVGRKVFMPGEYQIVGAAGTAGFLEAGADLSLRLLFQPPTASVAGFVAYPFYP